MNLQNVALFIGMLAVTTNATGQGKDVKRTVAEKKSIAKNSETASIVTGRINASSRIGLATNKGLQSEKKSAKRMTRTETIRIRYHVWGDANLPGALVVYYTSGGNRVVGGFISTELIWSLPQLKGKQKKAKEKQRKKFNKLIRRFEKYGINRVEFECKGTWVKPSPRPSSLRVKSVPQLTRKSKARLLLLEKQDDIKPLRPAFKWGPLPLIPRK